MHFKNRVEVTGGSGSYEFTNTFDRANTNGTSAGFEQLGSVYFDDGTGAGVTLSYSDISDGSSVGALVTLDGLQEGDVVIVRISVRLLCAAGGGGGVIQTRHLPVDDGIQIGNQTVPLNQTQQVLQPEVTITKTADAATVQAGSPIGFTITCPTVGMELPQALRSRIVASGGGSDMDDRLGRCKRDVWYLEWHVVVLEHQPGGEQRDVQRPCDEPHLSNHRQLR